MAFCNPLTILLRSNRSDLPSFFFTINSTVSMYSYEVKRLPQSAHSFRLLTVLSGESLVSRVFRFSDPQYGHFTRSPFLRSTILSVFVAKRDAVSSVWLFKPF